MSVKEMFDMNCRKATYLSELKREGKLTFTQQFGLWFHLLYCKACTLFVNQSKVINKHVHDYAGTPVHSLDVTRREKIKNLLDKEINNKPGWPV